MNNLDHDMQKLFQSVGIKPEDKVDKEIVDFIYDFVEKHGGIEAVKKEFGPGNAKCNIYYVSSNEDLFIIFKV